MTTTKTPKLPASIRAWSGHFIADVADDINAYVAKVGDDPAAIDTLRQSLESSTSGLFPRYPDDDEEFNYLCCTRSGERVYLDHDGEVRWKEAHSWLSVSATLNLSDDEIKRRFTNHIDDLRINSDDSFYRDADGNDFDDEQLDAKIKAHLSFVGDLNEPTVEQIRASVEANEDWWTQAA
jgi:hypothetical protein